jgi:threonine/homoserine/homoserine lactone efflux protein
VDFNVLTPITIGFFTAFIMGPVFWVLLETSITKGFRAAVAFDLGVMFADVCFIAICYFGSMQLLEVEQNKQGLFVLGGTILLIYGVFSWINRSKKNKNSQKFKSLKKITLD